MTAEEIRGRVTSMRYWALDREDYPEAQAEEYQILIDVLQAISEGASDPAGLARDALTVRLVNFERRFG